jgi:tetratricopeptide (TPR) repeat protein
MAMGGWAVFVALALAGVLSWGRYGARFDLAAEGHAVHRLLLEKGQQRAALRAARQAIRRHPADFYLHYLAGVAASQIPGEQPLRHFNRALHLKPGSDIAHRAAARALTRLGFPEQALGHALSALQNGAPLTRTFQRELFRLLDELWQQAEPLAVSLRVSVCLGGLGPPGLAPPSCLIAQQAGWAWHGEAMATLADADPRSGLALAETLRKNGQFDQALQAYEWFFQAGREVHDAVVALYELSLIRVDLGAARFWAEQDVERTGRPEAHERLIRVLVLVGRTAEAEQRVRDGLARFPDHVGLVALRVERLIARRAFAQAQAVLKARLQGKPVALDEEIRLLELRLKVEEAEGHRHRIVRLRGQIQQLRALLNAGARGYSSGRSE